MTTIDSVQVGQLVISTTGRDEDRLYLVAEILDDKFISLVDGELKTIKKPKRKNIKHVKPTGQKAEELSHKLLTGAKIADEEIKRVICELGSQPRRSLD